MRYFVYFKYIFALFAARGQHQYGDRRGGRGYKRDQFVFHRTCLKNFYATYYAAAVMFDNGGDFVYNQ